MARTWLSVGVVVVGAVSVAAQAPLEPADGSVYLGAWVDTSVTARDTPVEFNKRLGRPASAFQMAQAMPTTGYSTLVPQRGPINETLLEVTGSTAALFLTVYPVSLGAINEVNLNALGRQILSYQNEPFNRDVFLRFAPEMQGSWMEYGVRPTEFVDAWHTMYTSIKAIAPKTAIVWSPTSSLGYPYGLDYAAIPAHVDQLALDTAPSGVIDQADDAYSPYYPGDNYVDWCGLSSFWKGSAAPYHTNQVNPDGFTDGVLIGNFPANSLGSSTTKFTSFYDTYCASKNKPCMFSETGAAYHVNTTDGPGPGQLAIQQAWWRNAMTNTTFLDAYPKLKMFNIYEFQTIEDNYDLRDFRLTTNPDVLTSFQSDLATVSSRYLWASSVPVPSAAIEAAAASAAGISALPEQSVGPNVFGNGASGVGPAVWTAALVGLGLVGGVWGVLGRI